MSSNRRTKLSPDRSSGNELMPASTSPRCTQPMTSPARPSSKLTVTPGFSRWKAAMAVGRNDAAAVGKAANRSVPRLRLRVSRASRTASFMSRSMRRAWGKKCSPAGVSSTLRVLRASNCNPMLSSSLRTL
ncbi:hypothetical protein D3C76_1460320 [compost metagenome]